MPKAMRVILVLVLLVVFSAVPRAATAPSATQALKSLPANATGIYRLAYLNSSGSQKETLALVKDGRIVELHSRTTQQQSYLKREVRSKPAQAVNLGSSTFNQLISLAGGINKNVNSSSAATKQNFLNTAGLAGASGGGSTPLVVPPEKGQCPFAYELKITFKDGRKHVECRLKAELSPKLIERMLAWWSGTDFIPTAYAYMEWKWTMLAATSINHWGFMHTDNWGGTGVSGWEFNGFGFEILYLDTPGP